MTPQELVDGSVVKRVSRHAMAGASSVYLRVTVVLPDGGKVTFQSDSKGGWRRVVKKAKLKLTTKAAKAGAAALRDRIKAAVEAAEADTSAALGDHKILAAAQKRHARAQEKVAKAKRANALRAIRQLMTENRVSGEEAMEIWHSSVVEDVMSS